MSDKFEKLTQNTYTVTHSVGPHQAGIRLDQFLRDRYTRRSREQLKKAVESGAVSVQRSGTHRPMGKLKPSFALQPGDLVSIVSEKKEEPTVSFNYTIIFEDDSILVLNKPPHLPVHPAGRFFFNTLLTHLKQSREHQGQSSEFYLVHRIDKETSGVLLLAKTKVACAQLQQQFAERKTKKTYLAILRGSPPTDTFRITAPLQKNPNHAIRIKMLNTPVDQGGLPSETDFQVIKRYTAFTLVRCFPLTGRQHQIRAHAEIAGFPLVGDKLYGWPESLVLQFLEQDFDEDEDAESFGVNTHLPPEMARGLLMERHALHAERLNFTHPDTQRSVTFEAIWPQDFNDFINKISL